MRSLRLNKRSFVYISCKLLCFISHVPLSNHQVPRRDEYNWLSNSVLQTCFSLQDTVCNFLQSELRITNPASLFVLNYNYIMIVDCFKLSLEIVLFSCKAVEFSDYCHIIKRVWYSTGKKTYLQI